MSRSNHSRKPKNRKDRPSWLNGGWILESTKQQRTRIKREVNKILKDPEHEVIIECKGPKNAYDYP